MRLAELLAELTGDELERLAHEHVRTDEQLSRPAKLNMIEGVLRSYRFVQDFIADRQPPAFAILTLLLDADGLELPTSGFREAVMDETHRIAGLVARGEILGRDDQLRLYRRVLYEARRNDLVLDAAESAILGVLRRELGIAQVEHFLIEHHTELQEFWNKDGCFLHEVNALRSGGLLFARGATTVLAEDVAPLVRQVLGIEMDRASARRLFEHLGSAELADALGAIHAKTSGTKEERVERLVQHMVQPRGVLRHVALGTLKDLCRDVGAGVSGTKEETVDRLVQHFAARRDQQPEAPPPAPIVEARVLEELRFRLLFGSLRGGELADILRALPELRQSGTKDVRVATLWSAERSEETLLGCLMNRDLEAVLARLALRLGGSKGERITRIIDHFATVDPAVVQLDDDHSAADANSDRPNATDTASSD